MLGDPPSSEDVHSGRVTPLFFGSAYNNFGVDLFLEAFVGMAAPPGPAIARGNAAALAPLPSAADAAAAFGSEGGSSRDGGGGSSGSAASLGLVRPESPHFSGVVFKLQARPCLQLLLLWLPNPSSPLCNALCPWCCLPPD